MKLVAALAWYDEQPAMLARCVRSLSGVVDELVAYHARFDHYEAEPAGNAIDEWIAAKHAADQSGPKAHCWIGGSGSQIEIRAELMQTAVTSHADWILVVDADERVANVRPDELRLALEKTDRDVARVGWTQGPSPIRRLYRALPDLHVRDFHNGYHGGGRFLHGPEDVTVADAVDVSRWIVLDHDRDLRTPERIAAARSYRQARRAAGER